MNKKFIVFLLIVIAFITSVMFETNTGTNITSPSFPNNTVGQAIVRDVPEPPCTTDAECVPAACCHPSGCKHSSQRPDCSDIYCTAECKANTLDCGQGTCQCMEGTCAAVLN